MRNRGFWRELKRRHVYRVAAAYAIVGWLLIQVVTQVFPIFRLPDWIDQAIVLLILVGFPIALVLAWAFDATPHGIVRTDVSPAGDGAGTSMRRRSRRTGLVVGSIGVLIAIAAGAVWWHVVRGNTSAPRDAHMASAKPVAATAASSLATTNGSASTPQGIPAAPIAAQPIPAKSIAVLPFENLSTDKGNAYFADGMQDLILTKLADIGDLKVISRTSTMQYGSHPQNLKVIAQQLGVATILEGSVQKAGNQVLINVQLIDAQTDSHIWAEAYPRTLDNIFGVEGEVAQKVADALKAKLTPAETAHVAHVPTRNAAAYDLFMKGEYYSNRAWSSQLRSDYAAATTNYRAAIQQDPQFALAWATMAAQQLIQLHFTGDDGSGLAAQAKTAIDRALVLAPDLMEAHSALGLYRDYGQHDLDGALASFKDALAIQPQSESVIFHIAVIQIHRGQYADAIANLQRASTLSPRSTKPLLELANSYMALRRYPEALRVLKQAVAIDPGSILGVNNLAYVYVLQGELARGTAVLDAAPASLQNNTLIQSDRALNMLYGRNYAGARQLLAELKPGSRITAADIEKLRGDVEWAAGDQAAARPYYLRAAALLEVALKQNVHDSRTQPGDLGWVYARLGRTRDAIEQGQLGVTLHPMDKDVDDATRALWNMARIQAQVGQVDEAVAGLNHLLAIPAGNFVSVPFLRLDTDWDPIRHDPRFQALLKKYASAAPVSASSTTIEQGVDP